MLVTTPQRHLTWSDVLVAFLGPDYLSITQSFAHLAIVPLYLGKASLAAFLLADRESNTINVFGSLP